MRKNVEFRLKQITTGRVFNQNILSSTTPKNLSKLLKNVKSCNEKISFFIENHFYQTEKISYNIKVSPKIPEIYLMKFLSFFGENFLVKFFDENFIKEFER